MAFVANRINDGSESHGKSSLSGGILLHNRLTGGEHREMKISPTVVLEAETSCRCDSVVIGFVEGCF